ncbi:helix-turn-helix transcriptional regulator [Ornithinimicrobium sp. LYQ92]|uniref:helix-turn-helix transcriptional regulator n=1 Tax=Serinicoccus sp. LYQ92 TaxID=3378798 RepID=UPI003852EFBD
MTDTSPNLDLLNLKEASAYTRVPEATLRLWRHRGTGPRSFRLGRRVMYQRAELDAWVQDQIDAADRQRGA